MPNQYDTRDFRGDVPRKIPYTSAPATLSSVSMRNSVGSRMGSSAELSQPSPITLPRWVIENMRDTDAVEFHAGNDFGPKIKRLYGAFDRPRHAPQPCC